MTFEYTIGETGSVNVVAMRGELIDRNQASELIPLIDQRIENNNSKFVFDLAELKYINSSGLSVLIMLLTKARKAGGEVAIANVSPKVNELLIITKLNTVFIVAESTEAAAALIQ